MSIGDGLVAAIALGFMFAFPAHLIFDASCGFGVFLHYWIGATVLVLIAGFVWDRIEKRHTTGER